MIRTDETPAKIAALEVQIVGLTAQIDAAEQQRVTLVSERDARRRELQQLRSARG